MRSRISRTAMIQRDSRRSRSRKTSARRAGVSARAVAHIASRPTPRDRDDAAAGPGERARSAGSSSSRRVHDEQARRGPGGLEDLLERPGPRSRPATAGPPRSGRAVPPRRAWPGSGLRPPCSSRPRRPPRRRRRLGFQGAQQGAHRLGQLARPLRILEPLQQPFELGAQRLRALRGAGAAAVVCSSERRECRAGPGPPRVRPRARPARAGSATMPSRSGRRPMPARAPSPSGSLRRTRRPCHAD